MTRRRGRSRSRHTPLGRGLLGAAPAARCWRPTRRRRRRLLAYLRDARACSSRPETADGLDAPTSPARRLRARPSAGARAPAVRPGRARRAARGAADPAAGALPAGAAAVRRAAPRDGAGADGRRGARRPRAGDAGRRGRRALGAGAAAARRRAGRAAGRLAVARRHALDDARRGAAGRALAIRARRFRAVFVCGLQEGEFPRAGAPEPFLSDERRRELAIALGAAHCDRTRTRWRASATCSTRAVARHRARRARLSQLGRGGQPGAAVAVHRRRRRAVRAGLARAPRGAGCSPTSSGPARGARPSASASARWPAARRPRAGDEPRGPTRTLGTAGAGQVRHSRILSAGALESTATARSLAGRAPAAARPLEPDPEPIARGNLMHDVLERLLRELDGPMTAASLARAVDPRRLLAELGAAARPAGGGTPRSCAPPRCARSRPTCAATWSARRRRTAAGGRWASSCASASRRGPASLPALELGDGAERVLVRGMIDRVDIDWPGRAHRARLQERRARRQEWQVAHWAPTASCRWRSTCWSCASCWARSGRRLLPAAARRRPAGARACSSRGRRWACRRSCRRRPRRRGARRPSSTMPPSAPRAGRRAARRRARRRARRTARATAARTPRSAALSDQRWRAEVVDAESAIRARCAWTPEQLEAIDRRDGDLLLDAGAGSGKTSVLVERFVALGARGRDRRVRDPHHHVHREGGRRAARPDPACACGSSAREAARATEGAFISTIHGFCARLLRVARAGGRPRSPVRSYSTGSARSRSRPPPFDRGADELAARDPGAVELTAAYGRRGPARGDAFVVRAAALKRCSWPPGCRRVASPDDRGAAPAAGPRRRSGRRPSSAAVPSPGPRVIQALERVQRSRVAGRGRPVARGSDRLRSFPAATARR